MAPGSDTLGLNCACAGDRFQPWSSCFTFLGVSFFICKMGTITVPAS